MKIDSGSIDIGNFPLRMSINDIRGEGGIMSTMFINSIQSSDDGGRVQVRMKEGQLGLFMFKYTDTPNFLDDYADSRAKWWADSGVIFDSHPDLPTEAQDE